MIGFYDTWPQPITIDEIVLISSERTVQGDTLKGTVQDVRFRDGRTLTLSQHQVRAILCRPTQLVPAESGTKVIRVGHDDNGWWVGRDPVIAWAMCLDGVVRPVCPDGVYDDEHTTHGGFVEMPSGRVESINEHADWANFASVRDLVAAMAEAAGKPLPDDWAEAN